MQKVEISCWEGIGALLDTVPKSWVTLSEAYSSNTYSLSALFLFSVITFCACKQQRAPYGKGLPFRPYWEKEECSSCAAVTFQMQPGLENVPCLPSWLWHSFKKQNYLKGLLRGLQEGSPREALLRPYGGPVCPRASIFSFFFAPNWKYLDLGCVQEMRLSQFVTGAWSGLGQQGSNGPFGAKPRAGGWNVTLGWGMGVWGGDGDILKWQLPMNGMGTLERDRDTLVGC